MKLVTLCLFFVCVFCTSALGNEITNRVQADSTFGEKVVLCEIDFLPDSYSLSEQAKIVLDELLGQLEVIDTKTKTIRIEGFIGPQDTDKEPTRLAMSRALAVEDYLREYHKISFERFLTGHKHNSPNCRVEISIYDNLWQTDYDQIQVANKDIKDGPS